MGTNCHDERLMRHDQDAQPFNGYNEHLEMVEAFDRGNVTKGSILGN